MTLGIGYQGRDFAALLTDSMDFDGPERAWVPKLSGQKINWSGPRLAYIASGNIPPKPPDISRLSTSAAARELREWLRPYNLEFDPTDGHSFYALAAGGPLGSVPSICAIERLGRPRIAEPGDVLIIGCQANRARELGMEHNYGDLPEVVAAGMLSLLGHMIVQDLYAEHGCQTLADWATVKPGWWPGIAPPFHVAVIRADSTFEQTFTDQEIHA